MTKVINIGGVSIGGGNPIAIQSMTNIPVTNIEDTITQIVCLKQAGCDIARVAVNDMASALALQKVRDHVDLPIVADIHFDYRLAISAIEHGADKIRINPGNMYSDKFVEVIQCAKTHSVPIRIGVNFGSISRHELLQANGDKVLASVNSLMKYLHVCHEHCYDNVVLSIKSSSVADTINVNRLIAKQCDNPLHIGVTESGVGDSAVIKSAMGIGSLLVDGIGDTIRVSLTADPVLEVVTAKNILRTLGMVDGVQFVSCPQCGRCSYDLQAVAERVYGHVKDMDINLKVAVMGCEVNGPGECMDADIGMAGGNGKAVFFTNGKVYRTVDIKVAEEEFIKEINKIYRDFIKN